MKHKKIIAPLFKLNDSREPLKRSIAANDLPFNKGFGMIPQFQIACLGTQTDYIYWDYLNKIIDRLRLLKAEQTAGNPSRTNEIHSILEEPRESGYVY